MESLIPTESILTSKSSLNLSIADLSLFLNRKLETLKQQILDLLKLKSVGSFLSPQQVRAFLLAEGFKYPQQIISIQMLKGGVAKTTSVLNLGIRAAMYGAKVLFIDLDQQANLTFALGKYDDSLPVWLDIFEKKKTIEQTIVNVSENIDLVPSSLNNSVLERALVNSNRNWNMAVKGPLQQIIWNYDLVLIDTAPALSATNTAVTMASDQVLLPVNPDKFSIIGFEKNHQELDEIKKDFQLKFETKILFTKFDSRERLSGEYLEQFIKKYPKELMKNYIRLSSEAKSSLGTQKSIFSSKSSVREDYDLLTQEIMGWN